MKKGILVTSFGTSHIDTRKKSIEVIENKVKELYGEENVERVFTSNIIRKIIKNKENLIVLNHEEGVNYLKERGFDEIITMSLHILNGSEYKEKISHNLTKVTEPLLYLEEDYKKIVLDDEINNLEGNDALVFMGHGSEDIADKLYGQLQKVYLENGKENIFIGTVEGEITIEDVIEKLKIKNYKKILLKPFMIVSGDHAKNDMASDEEDSWKTILENEGFEVSVILKGLGEYELVQNMFIDKLKKIY